MKIVVYSNVIHHIPIINLLVHIITVMIIVVVVARMMDVTDMVMDTNTIKRNQCLWDTITVMNTLHMKKMPVVVMDMITDMVTIIMLL